MHALFLTEKKRFELSFNAFIIVQYKGCGIYIGTKVIFGKTCNLRLKNLILAHSKCMYLQLLVVRYRPPRPFIHKVITISLYAMCIFGLLQMYHLMGAKITILPFYTEDMVIIKNHSSM